jgi:hypothetical protein
MYRLSLHNAQAKSPWLVLAISLLILTGSVSATLLWPPGSGASDGGTQPSLFSVPGNYQSPQHCRECHEGEFQAWSGTTHADASFDPIFQVYLQSAEEPGECFSCHATGYNSATGQFVLAGVTCEACHGPYREKHPNGSMMIASPEELCGACHTGTLAEWVSSRHGRAGVTCVACHEVHTQKTHSAANTNALCAGCHQDQTRDSTHIIHSRSEVGIHCVDCHLARPRDDISDAVKGHVVTGHAFTVFVSTCSDCHPIPLQSDESP